MTTTWRERGRGGAGVVALVVIVGLGYYVGGLIGLQLRIPPATPSVLWPPNAVLTAALLVTHPRQWPLCLAAALPAHLLLQLPLQWPLVLIVALFITNCSEALIAAALLRQLSDEPARIDTLRRLTAFLIAVVIWAPMLSTFADASAVSLFRDEPYWVVWRRRLVSNMVAALVIVPALVGIVTSLSAEVRRGRQRWTEALLLMAGFALACLGLYGRVQLMQAFPAVTALVLMLPFALWAALRFGPSVTSIVLLIFALLISWGVVERATTSGAFEPETAVLLLQVLLLLVGITVLTLAAIIEERRETARALAERLRYEELLSRVSGAFVEVPSDRMSARFETWLGHLGVFLGVDCLRLYYVSKDERDLTLAYAWAAPGFAAPSVVVKNAFPWTLGQILDRQDVIVESARALPAEAGTDRASLGVYGFKSMLVMPLVAGDRVLGALGFGSATERPWPHQLVSSLRLAAEVFANALVRKQTEDALRKSEATKSAILESLTSGVAVIDRVGQLRTVNTNWAQFMRHSAIVPSPAVHVGDNFLESVRATDDPRLSEVMTGVKAILNGSDQRFVFEFVSHGIAGPRWWILQVVRLKEPEGGAVATYSDITERRRAETEAQRSRQDLAHVARVSTIGALVGSLAHQLNQPLAAIMTNAQAAALLLGRSQPDIGELRAILSDIVDDDRRAAEVIQWVRELLKKGAPSKATVDLGRVIRDVANLVRSDAVIRNVVVSLDVEHTPLVVHGDRVELEQVVLNLLVNALESLDEVPLDRRRVLVRCYRVTRDLARVSVLDSGPGFHDGPRDHLFEPFHTTKPGGLGMGLSIAHTIVEAYGGAIRASNSPQGGAVVEFTLPLDSPQEAV